MMATRRTLSPAAKHLLRLLTGRAGVMPGLPEARDGWTIVSLAAALCSLDAGAVRRTHYLKTWQAVRELRQAGRVTVTTPKTGREGRPRLLVRAA